MNADQTIHFNTKLMILNHNIHRTFPKEKESINIINGSVYAVMKKNQIPISGYLTYLRWEIIETKYKFDYDQIEDSQIDKRLKSSVLFKYDHVFLDLDGNDKCYYEIKTDFLTSNWNILLSLTGYEGMIAFTSDFKCVIEFTSDGEHAVYSTFVI